MGIGVITTMLTPTLGSGLLARTFSRTPVARATKPATISKQAGAPVAILASFPTPTQEAEAVVETREEARKEEPRVAAKANLVAAKVA